MAEPASGAAYDAFYYATGLGVPYARNEHWLKHFGKIADRIVSDIAPGSLLDAGCAYGILVELLRERGVDATGIDISDYAIGQAHPSVKPFVSVGSIAAPFPRRYDLIVTIEVLEHMPRAESEAAVANLCAHSDDILFSSTPLDYKEATHFNTQPLEYWATIFARHGFVRDVDFDASFITPWATRFRRTSAPLPRLLGDMERRFWYLWKENTDLRALATDQRAELSAAEQRAAAAEQRAAETDRRFHQEIGRAAIQLRDRDRLTGALRAQLDERDKRIGALNARLSHFEDQIHRKNQHIAYLEELLQRVQNGRVMQLLRRISGQAAPAALPAAGQEEAVSGRSVLRPDTPQMAPLPPADPYAAWIARTEPAAAALEQQRRDSRGWTERTRFSIVVPVYNPGVDVLRDTLESVLAQTYTEWELCLADGASTAPGVAITLAEYAERDQRIKLDTLSANGGISANSNAALALATGEFVLLLDHDDLIAPDLLYNVATALHTAPELDIIYYDEDKVSEDGKNRRDPWFKPSALSPALLLSVNYLMHSVIRRTLLLEVGGFRSQMDGAQDWDLALRLTGVTDRIHHIPRVLYHWRQVVGSAARDANAKPWAFAAQERCITEHLARLSVPGTTVSFPTLGQVRVHWPTTGALVSIIIPTKDKLDLLRPCLETILQRTSYKNFEIVLVDTGSNEPATRAYYEQLQNEPRMRFAESLGPFNWGTANNIGAQVAKGDVLLFLNNDTEAITDDWLTELVGWVERPEVGVVGAKLIRPDGTIQHAGVIMGIAGHGAHVFDGDREDVYGIFGSSAWYRNYMAVTGACLIVRREVFERLHGFDEIYQVGYSDLEFGLRVHASGLQVVYTPFARVLHHEGGSRGFNQPATDVLRATIQMRAVIEQGDPYFNPNLSRTERRPSFLQPGEETADERLLSILKLYDLADGGIFDVRPPPDPAMPMRSLLSPAARAVHGAPRTFALVSHDLSLSGAPLILYALAVELRRRGHQLTLLSPEDGPLGTRYAQAGIDVQIVPHLRDDARAAASALSPFDTVLANTIVSYRVVLAARTLDKRVVWWIHESEFGQRFTDDLPKVGEALREASALVFPAQATADMYRAHLRGRDVTIVHTGINEPAAGGTVQRQSDKLLIVHVGSVEPRKGQDLLLRALARLPAAVRAQTETVFIGRLLDVTFYERIASEARGLGAVRILGELDHADVAAYVRSADIFASTSRDEALPIVLLEAMALGRAIVSTAVGGIPEIITNGQDGLLAPVQDSTMLTAHLTALISDPTLRERLGASARARYEQELTEQSFVDAVEPLLVDSRYE